VEHVVVHSVLERAEQFTHSLLALFHTKLVRQVPEPTEHVLLIHLHPTERQLLSVLCWQFQARHTANSIHRKKSVLDIGRAGSELRYFAFLL
jgi:hypothetical protein